MFYGIIVVTRYANDTQIFTKFDNRVNLFVMNCTLGCGIHLCLLQFIYLYAPFSNEHDGYRTSRH